MNFYQDVFFRSMDILRGRQTIKRLHQLRKSQHWNLEQIKSWQLNKLNELIKQAKQNSPYYKEKLAHISSPLNSLDEITTLPILTKTDIRGNQENIKCSNVAESRFVESRTGGSTGEPMFYFWDKQGMDWNRASVYRSAEWANTQLGEKTVQMSGSHFDFTQSQSLKNRIVYFLQRYRDFSVAYLTDEILEHYYQELQEYKPTSIWGYAGGLNVFAEFIETNHPSADFSFLKAIMTSSEMLWPKQREKINQIFGDGKVFDQYGSRELYIAAECNQHNGYHIHSEIILAEIVDSEGNKMPQGEVGKIILTDLSNHAFPFIRYEIGDLGIMAEEKQCECGMWLPKLSSVQGRIADVITLKDRVLTAPNFATLFSDIRGLKAYQIRQEKIDEIEIVMVPDEHFNDEFENYIRSAVESMVEDQAKVIINKVEEIEVPESGKRRFIISNISQQHF
jgi:phenylacetate-CoA ligase